MAAIAASGEDAITVTIDVQSDTTANSQNFDDYYEIDRTATDIEEGDFKRVAMQFPDSLLHDSVPIFRALKRRLSAHRELYILADTSYGSCCVDEVAASHVDADAVIHYGYACMSQSPRIPVIYVFGKKPVDVDDCVNQFQKALQLSSDETGKERPVILRHDVAYTHQAVLISERLREVLEPHYMILYAEVPNKVYPTTSPSSPVVNEAFPENCSYLYIGGENLALTHLLMTHSDCDVISYSPPARSCRVESASPTANKLLMRRYAMIQKARDADVFGILVGTLGGSSYLSLIKHLRSLLRERSKKFYTISVGKLNPSKLANFMEIECFVLVACPENSLIDTKDFYRPIVTPYELEVALADDPAEAWLASGTTRAGGGYVLDFQKLLIAEGSSVSDAKGADAQCQNNEDKGSPGEDDDGDKPIFSLVTGKYRHPRRFGDSSPTSETNDEATASDGHTLIKTQHGELAMINDSAAGTFLREQRTYQGLDPRFGQDAPSTLEQGRSGIARGYGEVKSDS